LVFHFSLLTSSFQLPTSNLQPLASTFHFPLLVFHFPLFTFHFPLNTSIHSPFTNSQSNPSTFCLASRAILLVVSGFAIKSFIASTKAATSLGGTKTPSFLSSIRYGKPPTLVDTTGKPKA